MFEGLERERMRERERERERETLQMEWWDFVPSKLRRNKQESGYLKEKEKWLLEEKRGGDKNSQKTK